MTYLIIGVDPGKTVGMVGLDLNGNLVFSNHYPNASVESLIGRISEIGTPIIVAGDKVKPSKLVRQINASFSARIFSPKREFTTEMKRELGKGALIKNPHERDAYSAALAAYHSYANKFKQVEHIAANADAESVKRDVVLKHSIYESLTGKKANRS